MADSSRFGQSFAGFSIEHLTTQEIPASGKALPAAVLQDSICAFSSISTVLNNIHMGTSELYFLL